MQGLRSGLGWVMVVGLHGFRDFVCCGFGLAEFACLMFLFVEDA